LNPFSAERQFEKAALKWPLFSQIARMPRDTPDASARAAEAFPSSSSRRGELARTDLPDMTGRAVLLRRIILGSIARAKLKAACGNDA